jgi:branched-chain amino acid transport system substrate-binding protein
MKKTWSALIASILVASFITMTAACLGPVQTEKELKSATDNLQGILQSKLLNLNNAVSDAAAKIAKSGLKGEQTRAVLNGLCKKYPYLVDCSAADPQGKMITVAPDAYRRYEGTDTGTTDASKMFFSALGEKKKPVLSNLFRAVEGIDAVALIWPVVTPQGDVLGSISALFKPGDLVVGTIAPAADVRVLKINVAQTDGLVIYCSNGAETGKNLLTDERYKAFPALIAMGEKLVAQKTGTAEYTFIDDTTGKTAKKTVYWTTIGVNGTEWRLASIAELVN